MFFILSHNHTKALETHAYKQNYSHLNWKFNCMDFIHVLMNSLYEVDLFVFGVETF